MNTLLQNQDVSSHLRFGADGRLSQGETILASVDWADDGSFARIVVRDSEYDIVRKQHTGWHFVVVALTDGGAVCEFMPHQLHRGGRLKSDGTTVQLCGHPLHEDKWSFTGEGGLRIEARAKPLSDGIRASSSRVEVDLEVEESLGVLPNAPLMLAFGCWLIVQWDTFPVLVAGGGGPYGGI